MPEQLVQLDLADSHVHFFDGGYPGRYGRSPAGGEEIAVYESLRSEHRITRVLVVGYEGAPFAAGNNDYIRSLASSRPWLTTVAYLEVAPPPSPEGIESILDGGHAGVSLYLAEPEQGDAWLDWSPEVWTILESAAAIISLNVTPRSLERCSSVLRSHPGCRFLVSHLGLPGPHDTSPDTTEVRSRIRALLECAGAHNVFVKFSGLYATARNPHEYPHHSATPYVEELLATFGVDKCLWGSDFAPALDYVSFAQTISLPQLAGLTTSELKAVMGGNLAQILG